MRIGARLMLGSALGVLAAVFAVSFAAYFIARNSVEAQIMAQLDSTAHSRAAHVEKILEERREFVQLAATSSVMAGGLQRLESGGEGQASVVEELEAQMRRFRELAKDVYDVMLLDRHGRVVASTEPERRGLDRSTDAHFVNAKEGPFIEDAYHSSTTGLDSLAVSAPIVDRDGGDMLGVLVVRFSMIELNGVTTDHTGLGETGETYLINRDGFMITPSRFDSDSFLKRKVDSDNARECLADLEAMRTGALPGEHVHAVEVFTDYRGVRVLGAHSFVPEMGWGLLAEIDVSEAFAPIARMRFMILTAGVLWAAVALAVSYLFAQRITRPIHELHMGSERIGGGELGYRLDIKTGDEIEQLAGEFNRMAEKLSQSYTSLERKVAERTTELTMANESLRAEIAERKRAEDEIRRARDEWQRTFDAMADMVAILDKEHQVVRANETLRKAFPGREVIGEHCYELFHGADQPLPDCPTCQVFRTVEPAHCERCEPALGGRWFLYSAYPIANEDGEVQQVVHVAVDISERKRTEESLHASKTKYKFLVDNLPQRIFRKDRHSVYVSCNRSYAGDLRIEPDAIVGKTDYDFYPKELADKYRADDRRVMESGEVEEIEESYVKDGQEMTVHTVKTPLTDDNGDAMGILGIFWDVTDRKRAQEALRESEQKYRRLFEELNDAAFLADVETGIILDANAQAEALLARTLEEIIGMHQTELHPPGKADEYRRKFAGHINKGHVADYDAQVVRKDGTVVPVTISASTMTMGGKSVILGLFRDITHRRQAEEQLNQYSQQLESLNADLERSNRDLQEFTYTVSHDLKEPLRKIHAFGRFLEEDCGENIPEEGRQHLHRMQEAAVRMKDLIEHLLSLARVETQGKELVPVDLRPIIDEAVDVLSEKVRECGAEVVIEDGMPLVIADAVQLGQVFQNLVSNALKFRSTERAPKVLISGRADGPEATFSVADNGIGIEERFYEKIFGVFQRLHPQEQYEGAGVGLALCEKIVRRHGGRIWVDSQFGKDSTFHFTLSIAPAAKERDHEP